MKYTDLRDFIAQLETLGELKRIKVEVDPHLEMTEIADRVLRAGGPALLFEKPKGHSMPVLTNLFGTPRRVALGIAAAEGDDGAADLLAGRRRAADYLGPGRHARAGQDAAESRHLPPATARPEQADHALAGASRRRAGLSRALRGPPRRAFPGRGGDRCRSGDHPGGRHARTRYVVRIPVRRFAARR